MFEHLYIHVPFCLSKCDYCAFYSFSGASDELVNNYLKKMNTCFRLNSHTVEKIKSIYIGGGTPTLLSYDQLKLLLESIAKYFPVKDDTEWSIECNPETIDDDKCELLCSFVNRVSIGVQSFDEKYRNILGRKVSQKSILDGFEMFHKHNFGNLNCDLIYAIPGQSLDQWQNELSKAVEVGVKHISAYSLTIEEGSRLAPDITPDEDTSSRMWTLTNDFLTQYGIERYEISNYAKQGNECIHNNSIWHGDRYLGLGPASSSFDGTIRWTHVPDIDQWLEGTLPEQDVIPTEYRAKELFIMGLRTIEGWSREEFEKVSKVDYMKWQNLYTPFIQDDMMEMTSDRVRLNEKGLNYWDTIAEELI